MDNELKPCPFCGQEPGIIKSNVGKYHIACQTVYCPIPRIATRGEDELEDAIVVWNTRFERTCTKVPGKMHYGERRVKCSECGYGLSDKRYNYCPNCGAKVVSDGA